MNLKIRNILIFGVILLICSITPAAAAQTGDQTNDTKNFRDIWVDAINEIFPNIDCDETGEITPEQEEYFTNHSDLIVEKENEALNNLQLLWDFLLQKITKKIKPTLSNENSSLSTDYSESLKQVVDYLKRDGTSVTTKTADYESIMSYVNDPANTADYIVQIRDHDYVRYMSLVNIDENNIILSSSKQKNVTYPKDHFEGTKMFGNDINIIIIPSNYNATIVLDDIYDYQLYELNKEMIIYTAVPGGLGVFTGFTGAITGAGFWKSVDPPAREEAVKKGAETLGNIELDEKTPLVSVVDEVAAEAAPPDVSCGVLFKHKVLIVSIIAFVTMVILSASVITAAVLAGLTKIEIDNLNTY